MSACPSEETLLLYAQAELPEPASTEVLFHLDQCALCRQTISAFVGETDPAPMDRPVQLPSPGAMISERYRLGERIGNGGMGVVFSAEHVALKQKVAIKFLWPIGEDDRNKKTSRFLREARAAAELGGEHIVRVLDVAQTDEGLPYLVMEMLRGEDLARRMSRAPVSEMEGITWFREICSGLIDAHRRGIVHRDIKPPNLFLAKQADGSTKVKILDFGISKQTLADERRTESVSTQEGEVLGSPQYMSPEQLRNPSAVDARTDIWSLGATMFEVFSGTRAFSGANLQDLSVKICSEDPPRLRKLRPELSRELEQVVARCLDRSPERRFGSAAELRDELARISAPAKNGLVRPAVAIAGVALLVLVLANIVRDRGVPLSAEVVSASANSSAPVVPTTPAATGSSRPASDLASAEIIPTAIVRPSASPRASQPALRPVLPEASTHRIDHLSEPKDTHGLADRK